MHHRPKDVSQTLGISAATLRLWSDHFAPLLSPAAQKAQTESGTPAQRRYTDSDIAIFKRAKIVLGDGNTYESTLAILQAEPQPEPIEEAQEPLEEPIRESALSTNLDEHPVFVAFREALSAKDETIKSKDQVISALEANINDLRSELVRVASVPTLPWWKRLLGTSK